jgi:iron complex outermembrane receptor protein
LNLIEVILAQGSIMKPGRRAFTFADLPSTSGHTMASCFSFLPTPVCAAAMLFAASAQAQSGPPAAAPAMLGTVTITGRGDPVIGIGGWGDVPLSRAPFQASSIGVEQMRELGVQGLADIVRIDPSVSDAYNAEGYWTYLTVRGFVIDNRFNYRRDGLPISAETWLPLDNKERIEILKGTSGLQAGTSAPGGLVNLVVKRPTDAPLREARLAWREPGSVLAAVDLSQRFGQGQVFGLRLNAAYQHLDPQVRQLRGERHLFALAGDWRLTPDTLVEAEIESSHRSQPSQPAFSMLGPQVPAPGDPRINLNNQPWSLPVVMDGNTASLRLKQRLSADWSFTAHLASQQLRTDDRLAYPFGCSAENNFDRYCSDGSFDFYEFRSDGERRRTDALNLGVDGTLRTGGMRHAVSAGVLVSRFTSRLNPRLDDGTVVGTGNVEGTAIIPTLPALGTVPNTNRTERSSELYLRDAIQLTTDWTAWLGLRHTQLRRASERTNGSRATDYTQSFTTPSVALSYALSSQVNVYGSWGQGVESDVAPNRSRYANAGQALQALKSRQVEAGIKAGNDELSWGLAAFEIARPAASDVGPDCGSDSTPGSCTRQIDGSARHRGIEANGSWRSGAWSLDGGLQALHARREGSQNAEINGKRPTNVPALALKLQTRYRVAAVPGLLLSANLLAESDRMVLEDNSARIPGYGRVDLAARYVQRRNAVTYTWRAGVDNLLDRRAWRESPFQFGHAYLYPLAPRTLRASLEVNL